MDLKKGGTRKEIDRKKEFNIPSPAQESE